MLQARDRAPSRSASCPRCGCSRSAWTWRWSSGTEALAKEAEARRATSSWSPIPTDELDVAVIRATPGRHAGGLRSPTRRLPTSSAWASRRCSSTSSGCRSAGAAPRGGDPLPPPRRLLRQRHGRLARARGADPRARPADGRRSGASRTATSGPPTRTGPTGSSRWPTAARRRSATRSSTRSRSAPASSERATLYSSTEFKKIRLLYFTDDYTRVGGRARLSGEAAAARSAPSGPARSSYAPRARAAARRRQLARFARCARSAATRSSSSAARARELVDVDGNRYVDYVCSWGPLIAGHAHPEVVAAVTDAAARGTSFGAPTEGEVELAAEVVERVPARRDGADDLLRHGGGDERDPAGARRHRARPVIKFAGRLPRARRRAARRGGLRPRHAGHPGLPRRHEAQAADTVDRALERPRGASNAASRAASSRGDHR